MSDRAVPRTPFLLLKAPVSTLYEERYGGDGRVFTVSMYCARMASRSVPVGAAVDCAALDLHLLDEDSRSRDNNVRYWHDAADWDDYDAEYERVTEDDAEGESASSRVVPSSGAIASFTTFVDDLRQRRPGAHVAVFDARGGVGAGAFLVAHYMCARLRAPVHAAVASIAAAMAPGLYDENLLRALQTTFRGARPLTVPPRPDWAPAVENDDEEEEEEAGQRGSAATITIPPWDGGGKRNNGSSDSAMPPPPNKKPRLHNSNNGNNDPSPANNNNNNNDDALFVSLPSSSSRLARALTVVCELTNNQRTSSSSSSGASLRRPLHHRTTREPPTRLATASAARKALSAHRDAYAVARVPAGAERALLLLLRDGVFLLSSSPQGDGNGDVVAVRASTRTIRFPRPNAPKEPQHRTLLDGWLLPPNEKEPAVRRCYLATDILALEGGVVHHKPLGRRLQYLKGGVVDPKRNAEANNNNENDDSRSFRTTVLESVGLSRTNEVCDTNGSGGALLFRRTDVSDGAGTLLWEESEEASLSTRKDIVDAVLAVANDESRR